MLPSSSSVFVFILAISIASAARIRFGKKHPLNLDESLRDLLSIIRKPHLPERYIPIEAFKKLNLDYSKRMLDFSWQNCGNSSDLMQIQNISIGPDPLYFPGEIDVSFKINFLKTVDSPLLNVVTMDKKVGSQWITIPCIGNIGSCTYDDFCDILAGIAECPQPFIENNIPCKCPFNAGNYTLPDSKFDVPSEPFPAGDYRIKGVFSMNTQPVGCYIFFLTIGE